jgi:hypothetical protein
MKGRYNELMTFEALESLMTHLGGVREERKHVLVITNGFRLFTKNPALGMQMRSGSGPGIPIGGGPSPLGVAPRLGDSIGASGLSPQRQCETDLLDLASLDFGGRLEEIAAHARRNNVSLYPISPPVTTSARGRGFRGGPFTNATPYEMLSSLHGLAEDTDGIAIVNTSDVGGGLKKMLTATSAYYLLGYTPTNTGVDGKFRRITVKVKRSGTHVRARAGYVSERLPELRAVAPVAETNRPPDPLYVAINALALARDDMLHVRAASWMRSAGTASSGALWIVAELDERIRTAPRWKSGASAQLTLRPPGGGAALTRRVEIKADRPVAEFELADATPGLSAGLYGVQLEFIAADGAPVGDFVRLTMPANATQLGEAVLSRRISAPGTRYVRTADPRFRRNELVRLELPTTASIPASARLLDNKGGQLPVPAQVSEREDPSGAFRWIVVDIPMLPLAPAVYAVSVTQGNASQVAAFRVVP